MKHVYRVHPIIRHIAEYSSTENLLNSEFTIIHCRSEVNHCVEEREKGRERERLSQDFQIKFYSVIALQLYSDLTQIRIS